MILLLVMLHLWQQRLEIVGPQVLHQGHPHLHLFINNKRAREVPSSGSKYLTSPHGKFSKRQIHHDDQDSSPQRISQSEEATNFSDRSGSFNKRTNKPFEVGRHERKNPQHTYNARKGKEIHHSSFKDSPSSKNFHTPSKYTSQKASHKQEVNFIAKVKQHHDFEDLSDKADARFSQTARKVQKCDVQHLSDIKQAVNSFNTFGANPTAFPSKLTRYLLKYNFIDIKLLYAYGLAKKSKTTLYDSDEKSNSTSRIKPIPVNHFGHWQKLIETLRKAYTAAYQVASEHFILYFNDLLSFTQDMSKVS